MIPFAVLCIRMNVHYKLPFYRKMLLSYRIENLFTTVSEPATTRTK